MGVSTDGILVFGIDLGEETPEFMEDYDDDFEGFLHELSGLPVYGEPGYDYNKVKEFIDTYPVDMTYHCSYDYPMHILSVRGAQWTARRGFPEEINPDDLAVIQENLDALKSFCETYGIEWQEPKWYLCSMWG